MKREDITSAIQLRLKIGVPKSWFYLRLGMDRGTFNRRLKDSVWKGSEILALKELGVWYE